VSSAGGAPLLLVVFGMIVGCASSRSDRDQVPRSQALADAPGPEEAPLEPAPSPAPRLSAFAARVLASLHPEEVPALVRGWPALDELPKGASPYEFVQLTADPPFVCDGLAYCLVVDPDEDTFWVRIHGGIAGASEYRGPASLSPGGRVLAPRALRGATSGGLRTDLVQAPLPAKPPDLSSGPSRHSLRRQLVRGRAQGSGKTSSIRFGLRAEDEGRS